MDFQLLRRRPTLERILEKLRAEMPRLREEFDVRTLAVFGPYARGQNKRNSQLDILVEYDLVPGMFKFVGLEMHLSKLMGVDVHLVSKGGPKGEYRQRILNESVQV